MPGASSARRSCLDTCAVLSYAIAVLFSSTTDRATNATSRAARSPAYWAATERPSVSRRSPRKRSSERGARRSATSPGARGSGAGRRPRRRHGDRAPGFSLAIHPDDSELGGYYATIRVFSEGDPDARDRRRSRRVRDDQLNVHGQPLGGSPEQARSSSVQPACRRSARSADDTARTRRSTSLADRRPRPRPRGSGNVVLSV